MDTRESYRRDRLSPVERFDEVEPTISHLFRKPHPALGGKSYGGALYGALEVRGLLAAGTVTEVGGGTGFVARALVAAAGAAGHPLRYRFVELSPQLLDLQQRALPGALGVRAEAQALPFRAGALAGLVLANEVIADLPVARAETPVARAWLDLLGLEAPAGAWINVGALELVDELARALAPGAAACLVEFGGDAPVGAVSLEGRWGQGRHTEYSIHFGHLEAAARARKLAAERVPLADLLGIDRRMRVASYPDCVRLRRFVPSLPVLAHPRDELVRRHPLLTRFFSFDFPEIGSPRFPDPKSKGGFCQLFQALLLTQPR